MVADEALPELILAYSVHASVVTRRRCAGLSADYLNATSVLSQPLICWFASHGCTGACRKLLAAKANPDVRELNFEAGNPTALLLACRGGFADCVEALIEGGADPHLTDDFGITPFHEAASSPGSTDHTQAAVISVLLQHPSAHKLLHKVDAAGQSPLAHAAALGFTACVKLLLEAYSPFLRAQLASKALVIAAEAGRTSVVEALIAAGAVSAPDSDGPSALEVYACCILYHGALCICAVRIFAQDPRLCLPCNRFLLLLCLISCSNCQVMLDLDAG